MAMGSSGRLKMHEWKYRHEAIGKGRGIENAGVPLFQLPHFQRPPPGSSVMAHLVPDIV